MINIYTSSWDVCPEVDVVIVDARVFVLGANKMHQRNSNHLNFFMMMMVVMSIIMLIMTLVKMMMTLMTITIMMTMWV